jgi:glucuronosyltransferase
MTLTFHLSLLLLVAGCCWNGPEPAESANILFLSPITSYSHTHFFFYSIKALASRGHTITHWNGLKPREDIGNVTHLHSAQLQKVNSRHEIGFDTNNPVKLWLKHPERMANTCRTCYNDPVFHQLMTSREHFDLIVIEAFMNECMLPLVHHFRAPFIYMSGLPPLPWILESTCTPMSTQEYPGLVTDFTSDMNLVQRTINIAVSTMMVYFRNWLILPRVDAEARQAWINSTEPLPTVKEIENQLSLFITNSQASINYQYFKSSTIVEAGGLHLRPPKPLSKVIIYTTDVTSQEKKLHHPNFHPYSRQADLTKALFLNRKNSVLFFCFLGRRVVCEWVGRCGIHRFEFRVDRSRVGHAGGDP